MLVFSQAIGWTVCKLVTQNVFAFGSFQAIVRRVCKMVNNRKYSVFSPRKKNSTAVFFPLGENIEYFLVLLPSIFYPIG
jgi:hypothetical protein